jgi:hypothetical protein
LVWAVFLSAFMPRQDAREIALTFTRPTIVATPLEQPVTFWGRDRLLKIRRLGVERTTTLKMLAIR